MRLHLLRLILTWTVMCSMIHCGTEQRKDNTKQRRRKSRQHRLMPCATIFVSGEAKQVGMMEWVPVAGTGALTTPRGEWHTAVQRGEQGTASERREIAKCDRQSRKDTGKEQNASDRKQVTACGHNAVWLGIQGRVSPLPES